MRRIILVAVAFFILSCAANPHKASVKIYLQQKQPEKAVEEGKKWVQDEPDNPDARMWLALAYVNTKDYVKAADVFIEGFNLDSTYLDTAKLNKIFSISGTHMFSSKGVITTLINAASLEAKKERLENSLKYLNYALKLNPKNAKVYLLLSGVYQKLNKPEKVKETLERAVSAVPEAKEPHYFYAVTLLDEGKLDEALEHLHHAIKIDSNYAKAYYEMGVIYFKKKDYENAEKYLKKALSKDPGLVDGWFSLGITLYELDKKKEALDAFKRYTEVKPEDVQGFFYLGVILYELERYDEALNAINTVLAKDPQNVDAWNYKGLIYKKMGKTKEALEAFKKATELEKK